MKMLLLPTALALAAAFTLTGCETTGQSALVGAGTGAAVGGLLHGRGDQALVGAAIGAAAGALIGKVAKRERERSYEEGYYAASGSRYPVGRRTGRYGLVRSPYAPGNLIDVRDIPPGAKVVDPSCDRIFINP